MTASVHFLPNVTVLRIAQCSKASGMRSYTNDTRHQTALFAEPPRRGWVPFGVFCRDTSLLDSYEITDAQAPLGRPM